MSRRTLIVWACGLSILAAAGCARSLELDTISHFTTALEEGDVEALRNDSSKEFQAKALRGDEALNDLKLLRLPKGEVAILEQKEVSKTEKLVTVSVGKSERKIRYKLVRSSADDEKWVVDDIIVRQSREGITVAKSVTEQMDLLLAVREFLDAWATGSRDEALAVTTTGFRDVLDDLPAGYLATLTADAIGERDAKSKLKPDVQMDADVAVVTLPGDDGKLVMSYRLREGKWLVSDLAVESRSTGHHIPSVAKLANVVRVTNDFLSAYAAGDKAGLKEVSTRKFYSSSLAPADLRMVVLPGTLDSLGDYEVTLNDDQADVVVRRDTDVTRFALVRQQSGQDSSRVPRFLVEEVTIFEMDGRQEKRLSSLFTSHATMLVFCDALQNRNLPLLRKTSSSDFNKRVWSQLDELKGNFPLEEIEKARPKVLSTTFDGAVTEITVMQGTRALTYVLRDENSQMRVDDVHVPVLNRPTSLKTSLELMIPANDFVAGIDANDVKRLQRTSSEDLNRLVWRQTDNVPPSGFVVPRHLQQELSTVRIGDEQTTVVLGNARHGARVKLVKEYGRYVIDDILLVAGAEAAQRVEMKRTMRVQLAERGSLARTADEIRTAARPTTPVERPTRAISATGPASAGGEASIPPPAVAPLDETFGSAEPRESEFRIINPSAN